MTSNKHAGKLMDVLWALVLTLWLVEQQKQATSVLQSRFYLAANIVGIILPPTGQTWRDYVCPERWDADFRTWISAAEFIYETETS